MKKEYIIRGIQHLLSIFIFDLPILISFKHFILKLFFKIGKRSYIYHHTIFASPHSTKNAYVDIGNHVAIEFDSYIDYSGGLIIKDNVTISEGVLISTHHHHIIKKKLREEQAVTFHPLVVEEDVWIGAKAVILDSVKIIGKGAIIGAGAIVRKNVKPWKIVLGNPAEVVGERMD